MNTRLMGLLHIIMGIALVVWGYGIYDVGTEQINSAIPLQAWIGFIVGAMNIFVGITKLK